MYTDLKKARMGSERQGPGHHEGTVRGHDLYSGRGWRKGWGLGYGDPLRAGSSWELYGRGLPIFPFSVAQRS